MRFAKPPETIDQQIDRLIRRGMAVPDRERAAHYLSHLNYYRLRGYWLPFELTPAGDDHCFEDGTNSDPRSDQAMDRYVFDRELRLLVLDAIERIEVSLRTQWAYHLSHAHGAHAHRNRSLFSKQRDFTAYLMNIVSPGHHWKERLLELMARHDHIPTATMGFPEGWRELAFWVVAGEASGDTGTEA